MSRRVTIVRPGLPQPASTADDLVLSYPEFRDLALSGRVLAHLGRHREGRLLVHRLESAGRPLPLSAALRAVSHGPVYIEDVTGRRRNVSGGQLIRWAAQIATEPFRVSQLLHGVERDVADLERRAGSPARAVSNPGAPPVYLRTDLSFGVRAGGSVGHIAGVINEMTTLAGPPVFFTTDDIPALHPAVEVHPVAPSEAFWNFKELPAFVLNDAFASAMDRVLANRPIGFVYQRYSLNNYAGIRLAHGRRVPLVLEYNGSEIWMSRHWGRPLKHEQLAARIERLNLSSADLVVVVSRPMADEIGARGIDASRVLVNPNGVDPERYRPDIDSRSLRHRLGLGDSIVVGFIGTFGPWHGAEVLARAFAALIAENPTLSASTRLLMIGDGATMPAVRRIVEDAGIGHVVVFTGLVPQADGPPFLAACDILVSPHVPNPDGTPFFGSPTKLFEYMATGRSIVASDLDQIGDVLSHGHTAWMVPPGNDAALTAGLRHLIADGALRRTLGDAARRTVLSTYTWRHHVKRTLDRLAEVSSDERRANAAAQA